MSAGRGLGVTRGPLRLAHRGDWRHAPENTLEAFAAAMAVPGCDGVELDVRRSGDGVPVILHDETLARVQRRAGRADAMTAADLAQAGIPSLATVFGTLPDGAFVDVELKGTEHGSETAEVLLRARGPAGERAVVSSFEAQTLVVMREWLPSWRRWLNAEDCSPRTLARARDLGCHGVAALWAAITPRDLRAAAAMDIEVAAWTVRRRDTFDRLGRLGVVACCVEAAALDG